NVFKPVMVYNFVQSARLIGDAAGPFLDNCVTGIEADQERSDTLMRESLKLVTALNPHTGYDNAARVATKAYEENRTLQEVAVELGLLPEEQFDEWVRPENMRGPRRQS